MGKILIGVLIALAVLHPEESSGIISEGLNKAHDMVVSVLKL